MLLQHCIYSVLQHVHARPSNETSLASLSCSQPSVAADKEDEPTNVCENAAHTRGRCHSCSFAATVVAAVIWKASYDVLEHCVEEPICTSLSPTQCWVITHDQMLGLRADTYVKSKDMWLHNLTNQSLSMQARLNDDTQPSGVSVWYTCMNISMAARIANSVPTLEPSARTTDGSHHVKPL